MQRCVKIVSVLLKEREREGWRKRAIERLTTKKEKMTSGGKEKKAVNICPLVCMIMHEYTT